MATDEIVTGVICRAEELYITLRCSNRISQIAMALLSAAYTLYCLISEHQTDGIDREVSLPMGYLIDPQNLVSMFNSRVRFLTISRHRYLGSEQVNAVIGDMISIVRDFIMSTTNRLHVLHIWDQDQLCRPARPTRRLAPQTTSTQFTGIRETPRTSPCAENAPSYSENAQKHAFPVRSNIRYHNDTSQTHNANMKTSEEISKMALDDIVTEIMRGAQRLYNTLRHSNRNSDISLALLSTASTLNGLISDDHPYGIDGEERMLVNPLPELRRLVHILNYDEGLSTTSVLGDRDSNQLKDHIADMISIVRNVNMRLMRRQNLHNIWLDDRLCGSAADIPGLSPYAMFTQCPGISIPTTSPYAENAPPC